jgi:hypothetical protein
MEHMLGVKMGQIKIMQPFFEMLEDSGCKFKINQNSILSANVPKKIF